MLKIIYIYHPKSALNQFLERQIKESNLEGYELEKLPLSDSFIKKYDLDSWHTVIFEDKYENELLRFDGPFSSKRIEAALELSKGILANRLKESCLNTANRLKELSL